MANKVPQSNQQVSFISPTSHRSSKNRSEAALVPPTQPQESRGSCCQPIQMDHLESSEVVREHPVLPAASLDLAGTPGSKAARGYLDLPGQASTDQVWSVPPAEVVVPERARALDQWCCPCCSPYPLAPSQVFPFKDKAATRTTTIQ